MGYIKFNYSFINKSCMTRSILASIIVPVYNVEPYIDQCLRSVLSQTIRNIEVIVVDDCSTDNSAMVVKKYCKIDNRIIFLQHDKNKGLSNTRNTGLSYAKGEFIFFVDSDDYVDDNYCARLIYAIEKEQADVACCNVLKVYDNAVISPYKVRNENASFPSLITPHVMNSIMSVVWNKVYKRQIINKEKIKFTPNINNEDELWWREYCLLSSRVAWVDGNALYFYRCRQASLMRKMTNFERIICSKFLNAIWHLLKKASAKILLEIRIRFIFRALYNMTLFWMKQLGGLWNLSWLILLRIMDCRHKVLVIHF